MNPRFLSFALSTLLLAPAFAARAEDPKPPGERRQIDPAERAEMMKKNLGLSDEQTTKVREIYEKAQEKGKAIMADTNLAQSDRREKMMAIMKETREEVSPILTPEQREKAKEMMEKRRAEREAKKDGAEPKKDGGAK